MRKMQTERIRIVKDIKLIDIKLLRIRAVRAIRVSRVIMAKGFHVD